MSATVAGQLSSNARKPLDEKNEVNTFTDLEGRLVFDGLITWVKDEKKHYKRVNGVWIELIGSVYVDEGPNKRLDLWKQYTYYLASDADNDSSGADSFEAATIEGSIFTTVIIASYRTNSGDNFKYNQRLVAVYDNGPDPAYLLHKSADINSPLVPAKFIPVDSIQAKYGYVRRYELNSQGQPTIIDWQTGELCIFTNNNKDYFATALNDGTLGQPSSTTDTSDWRRVAAPEPGNSIPYTAGNNITIINNEISTMGTNPYIEISTENGLRVRELPVLKGFNIVQEINDKNSYTIRYQLDKNTRVGTRMYGTPGLTLDQVKVLLSSLQSQDYDNGVKLYVQTIPISQPDPSLIALDTLLNRGITLAPAKLSEFPVDPGAPQSLVKNDNFEQPFTGNEATGWNTSGGWVWDNLNFLAVAPANANAGNGNGLFLYQSVTGFTVGAAYKLIIDVRNLPDGTPVSGGLYSGINGTQTLLATSAGVYTFTFNASNATLGFNPNPNGGAFTGAIKSFNIYRVQ